MPEADENKPNPVTQNENFSRMIAFARIGYGCACEKHTTYRKQILRVAFLRGQRTIPLMQLIAPYHEISQ